MEPISLATALKNLGLILPNESPIVVWKTLDAADKAFFRERIAVEHPEITLKESAA